MLLSILVEVHDAGCTTCPVSVDLADVRIRTNLTISRRFGLPNYCRKRARLGAVLTAVTLAEPTMLTGDASSMLPRDDGHRRGKGMPSELARGCLEQHA